jgi:transcriptional regulator with XRE-family HTH domain
VPAILLAVNMDHRPKSYLRTFRRRVGFTQKELAFLFGTTSRSAVSRVEGSIRKPSLESLIASAFIFGVSPIELFPAFVAQLHGAVLRRANELYEELQGDSSKTTRAKLNFLEKLLHNSAEDRSGRSV